MELRTYTLANEAALQQYVSTFWPQHIETLRKYGITVHGVWTDPGSDQHRVLALVGYAPGADPLQRAQEYGDSNDYVTDHSGFDAGLILSTHTTALDPIAASPLQ